MYTYTTSPPYHGIPVRQTVILPGGEFVHFSQLHVTESPNTIQVKGGVAYWYVGVLDGYAYYTGDRELAVHGPDDNSSISDIPQPDTLPQPTTTGDAQS